MSDVFGPVPEGFAQLRETTVSTGSPLMVNVEFMELFEWLDHDEARAFEFLGKLKDLLA